MEREYVTSTWAFGYRAVEEISGDPVHPLRAAGSSAKVRRNRTAHGVRVTVDSVAAPPGPAGAPGGVVVPTSLSRIGA
jgi:hypothetical protein